MGAYFTGVASGQFAVGVLQHLFIFGVAHHCPPHNSTFITHPSSIAKLRASKIRPQPTRLCLKPSRFPGTSVPLTAGTGSATAARITLLSPDGTAASVHDRSDFLPDSSRNWKAWIPYRRRRGPGSFAGPGFLVRDCAPREKSKPEGFECFRPSLT